MTAKVLTFPRKDIMQTVSDYPDTRATGFAWALAIIHELNRYTPEMALGIMGSWIDMGLITEAEKLMVCMYYGWGI